MRLKECGMQKTFEDHKIRNAAETLHFAMYTESCFCLVLLGLVLVSFANNSSFCIFLDQGAIPCVKELETIMLMTSVK